MTFRVMCMKCGNIRTSHDMECLGSYAPDTCLKCDGSDGYIFLPLSKNDIADYIKTHAIEGLSKWVNDVEFSFACYLGIVPIGGTHKDLVKIMAEKGF